MSQPNYITPAGFAALLAAHHQLFAVERPKIVEVVSWAAGNGDRSENGDYLYGRKRLREIDRELNRLARRMKDAQVVDPRRQPDKSRIFFGATVTVINEQDVEYIYTLVGADEADSGSGRISWNTPIARALRGAQIGDTRIVQLPGGSRELEVVAVNYPD